MNSLYLIFLSAFPLLSQTAPCGLEIVRTEGSAEEHRFVAAAPEHVRDATLRALPAVAAKVTKQQGFEIRAKTDRDLYDTLRRRNSDAGVQGWTQGTGAMGTFEISIQPEQRGSVRGSSLDVRFHKPKMHLGSDKYGTPLANEIVCLANTLSPVDPTRNPRGPESPDGLATQPIGLPQGTPVKLTLRGPLSSKEVVRKKQPEAITFEVAEDVKSGGATVIRRGALAVAHLTMAKGPGGYGRQSQLTFQFDHAVAVDGQEIRLASPDITNRGGRRRDEFGLTSPAFGWAFKGQHTLVRAGTGYETETAKDYVVKPR